MAQAGVTHAARALGAAQPQGLSKKHGISLDDACRQLGVARHTLVARMKGMGVRAQVMVDGAQGLYRRDVLVLAGVVALRRDLAEQLCAAMIAVLWSQVEPRKPNTCEAALSQLREALESLENALDREGEGDG